MQAVSAGEGLDVQRGRGHTWPLTRAGRAGSAAERGLGPPLLALGDAAAVAACILAGAHIVRVHDVAPMLPSIRIADAILAASRSRP